MNKRVEARERTRTKIIESARHLFKTHAYEDVTIRRLIKVTGMSAGGIFNVFDDKAAIWRAAMECEPPIDRVVTRHADELAASLDRLVEACRSDNRAGIEEALAQAEALLARLDQKTE